uniref:C-CAP/cofactor C-like domain-containing protein n=1 Tax=Panagrolaimus sp. PS1159 TaxID=55785 RepID=A0AC35ESE4_9BILA
MPCIKDLENVDQHTRQKLEEQKFTFYDSQKPGTKIIKIISPDNYIVENLKHATIFVPPVKHEIFLSDLSDCIIACSAQQIRIRRCHRLKLYNYVSGSVFAEECSEIQLFPYIFHAEGDERRTKQLEKRHFATFQCLDNPFNPAATFSVSENSYCGFFSL